MDLGNERPRRPLRVCLLLHAVSGDQQRGNDDQQHVDEQRERGGEQQRPSCHRQRVTPENQHATWERWLHLRNFRSIHLDHERERVQHRVHDRDHVDHDHRGVVRLQLVDGEATDRAPQRG